MKKLLSCFAALVLVLAMDVSAELIAFDVSSTGYAPYAAYASPAIDGFEVVWSNIQNSSDFDIYKKDISLAGSPVVVANESNMRLRYSDISGDIVAWERPVSSGYNIYYSQAGQSALPIDLSQNSQTKPAVSNNRVVWEEAVDSSALIAYSQITETAPTARVYLWDNAAKQNRPDIDSDLVVWQQQVGTEAKDIALYDLKTASGTIICDSDSEQYDPKVSGKIVAWVEEAPTSSDVIAYDFINEQSFPICNSDANQKAVDICSRYAVWQDYRDGIAQIYALDMLTFMEFKVSTSTSAQNYPAVSDEAVIWMEGNVIKAALWPTHTYEMLSPVRGDEILAGSRLLIQWFSSRPATALVRIEYSTDHGENWLSIVDQIENSGSYDWQMPSGIASGSCMIRILEIGGQLFDSTGTGSLKLKQCDPALTADLTGDCIVDINDLAIFVRQWMTNGL